MRVFLVWKPLGARVSAVALELLAARRSDARDLRRAHSLREGAVRASGGLINCLGPKQIR
jgi:hypothetical protein